MTTLIIPLSGYFNRRIGWLRNLRRLAGQLKFFLSKQEETTGMYIALDRVRKRLLYFKKGSRLPKCLIINLAHLDKCAVVKQYDSIAAGEVKKQGLQAYVKAVFLRLRIRNGPSILLPFYEAQKDRKEDLPQMEHKAKLWCRLASTLLVQ